MRTGRFLMIAMLWVGVEAYGQIDLFPPVAVNDNRVTAANSPVTFNVVQNDFDPDLGGGINPASVDINTSEDGIQNSNDIPQGDFAVDSLGNVTFTPADDFSGQVSLSYTVEDEAGKTSNSAAINITVNAPPANVAPVANNDNATTPADTPVTINVVANDTDSDGTINVSTVDLNTSQNGIQKNRNTPQGKYTVNPSGVVTFDPKKNFSGATSLTYQVNDNDGATSNIAQVTVTINAGENLAPIANLDQVSTGKNKPVTFNIITNDEDSDGTIDAATIDLNTSSDGMQKSNNVPQGNFTVTPSGELTFTPAEDFLGRASINYTVRDNTGAISNEAAINVEVGEEITIQLDIPTGFTPNGDGANETWKILSKEGAILNGFEDAEIRVYSKRGVLVYEARGFEKPWDGRHNGNVLPADTYYYTIDLNYKGIRRKGIVTILR